MAAEHDALCMQVYGAALSSVRAQAALEGNKGRKLAVVLDIDETVLDNSSYQAQNVLDGQTFSPATWNEWVSSSSAVAIPGARDFIRDCTSLGVSVFYITNRTSDEEAATRRNLELLGFPIPSSGAEDTVLCKGELDTSSDKSKRRSFVESTHTVVAWIGDDLGDFLVPAESLDMRLQQTRDNAGKWGTVWFALPNAMYGSWARAVDREAGLGSPASLLRKIRGTGRPR